MCFPPELDSLIDYIETNDGWAPDNHSFGKPYNNREGHPLSNGEWIEYDVKPSGKGVNLPRNDLQRLIINRETGEIMYSPDHYKTMIAVDRSMPEGWYKRK